MGVSLSEMPLVDLLEQVGARGECRHDPELHTGPDVFEQEPAAARLAREDVARAVCEECPVWDLCLDLALRTRPTHGVWAGHLPYELAALRREVRHLDKAA
jgi:WhiB family redox-sensing transcriptional regulator